MYIYIFIHIHIYFVEGRFVESVKNTWWSMSPQEAGDRLKCIIIIEFKVQIICEHIELPTKLLDYFLRSNKSNINQDTTSESMRANGTDQQPVLLVLARWWPDLLPEFESERWWHRPQTRVKCIHDLCGFVENPSLKGNKCNGCRKRMQGKSKRLDGIVLTNADPRYGGKSDDPRGGDKTMPMQQVRKVKTVIIRDDVKLAQLVRARDC